MSEEIADSYPLSAELEVLWEEMQALRQHPNYELALERLHPERRIQYGSLMRIYRRWLADRREQQVREAISAIRARLES